MKESIKDKPLVSFCLLTYNQENFIEEALEAALKQSYSPLEIIISDDCSTDKTRDVINEIVKNYKGDHKINVNFNKVNLGLAAHFSKVCMEVASGEYIIVAAGDDISFPERTSKSVKFLKEHPDSYIADFGVDYIDENGTVISRKSRTMDSEFNLNDFLSGTKMGTMGCSRIYRKKLFDFFGALDPLCPTEDTTGVLRGLLIGKIWVLKEKVLFYRIHASSISSPGNMVKLKINKIFNQYSRDVEKAFAMNLITNLQYKELRQFLKKMSARRHVERRKKILRLKLKSLFQLITRGSKIK